MRTKPIKQDDLEKKNQLTGLKIRKVKYTKGAENMLLYQKSATEVREVKFSSQKGKHEGQIQDKVGQMSQLRW